MMRNLLLYFFFLAAGYPALCQEGPTTNPFEKARNLATSGEYEGAIEILVQLRDSFPQNKDYQIYLSRVYSWNREYSKAVDLLEPLVKEPEVLKEALEVMINVQLWSNHYPEMLSYAELGIQKFDETDFYLAKAKALNLLKREKEALLVLERLLEEDPGKREVLALQTEILSEQDSHLSLGYFNTSFSNPGTEPWHLVHLEYKTGLGKVPVVARLNHARLFDKNGQLLELEAYPRLADKSYLYLNAGVGLDTPVFPEIKFAAEYFHTLNDYFGFSAGGRYFKFENQEVYLFTSEISYRPVPIWKISYRPYLTNLGDNFFLSHSLSFRRDNYLKEAFLQLDLQYGSIPYMFYTSQTFTSLTAFRAGVQYRFRLSKNLFLQPGFLYEYEEYRPSSHRNKYVSQLLTTFRF